MKTTKDFTEHPAIKFVREHEKQIRQKAKKFGMDVADLRQVISLFIIEKGDLYDPKRGTFSAFVFGHIEKMMLDEINRAHPFPLSNYDKNIEMQTHSQAQEVYEEKNYEAILERYIHIPGMATFLQFLNVFSGKSSGEVAKKWGLTRRRVNQILKREIGNAEKLSELLAQQGILDSLLEAD